jgi:phosphoserine aminotransferase
MSKENPMERVFNFSAGPSMLPLAVLEKARDELLNYRGSGQSVMEMSHRSPVYESIQQEAEDLLRELVGIPEDYAVLFLQGGACTQFAMVPLNLFGKERAADYHETGVWAKRAIAEAKKYGTVRVTASSADRDFSYIPAFPAPTPGADYLHITSNNTIYGTRYTSPPPIGPAPLVADMSSCLMSEPLDVRGYGLIYAGAQKNLGPAGVTIVIMRRNLAGRHLDITPTMLRYSTHIAEKSLYNTPPCFAIYVVKLVLESLKAHGGLETAGERSRRKAGLLYDFLDGSSFYRGTAEKKDRSLMNVPFTLADPDRDADFLKQAETRGLINLKGHRLLGGMRASLYNAMPEDGVQALIAFMRDFERSR